MALLLLNHTYIIPAHVEVDASLIEGTQPNNTPSTSALSAKKKKHLLSTFTDPVYEELRDINFSQIGVYLNKIAKTIDQRYKVGRVFVMG